MKILIVGGNRFAGADVVSQAVLDGHDVTVLALDPPNIRARSHVRFIQANRNNRDKLVAGLQGLEFDAVLDNIAFTPANVELLLDVLKGRVGRYVMTSTVDIYPRDVPLFSVEWHEKLSPSSLTNAPDSERYFRGKRGCEKVLRNSGVPWSIIRPSIVYGRTDPVPPAPRALHGIGKTYGRSLFLPSRVVDGGPILLRQSDRRVFRLVSSQDVATALLHVAQHPDAVDRAFNVAGDEVWTSERLVNALGSAAGTATAIVRAADEDLASVGLGDYDSPYGRIAWWSVTDNQRLKSIGWRPTPASTQLTKLVEAVPPSAERPFYDRRMQEIALAKRLQRQQRTLIVRHGNVASLASRASTDNSASLPATPGRFSMESAEAWARKVGVASAAVPAPHGDHFREFQGCTISSIGIGTHRGHASAEDDEFYRESLTCAIEGGINLIDTAINYRRMRSERTVGRVLIELEDNGFSRRSLCLCSKGGYVPQDGDDRRSAQDYIWDEYVVPGLIDMSEAIKRHSIKSGFIRKLITQSLANMRVEHIDVYYIHNPERALEWMGPQKFFEELRRTFGMLEESVAKGLIGCYGIATWEGLRTSPHNAKYLSLQRIHTMARDVGGHDHNFKAVQFPLNGHAREALIRVNQTVDGKNMTLLAAASALGLYTFTSASIYRGQDLPLDVNERLAAVGGGLDVTQAALNFCRSAAGVGTSLVGMRKKENVEKALSLIARPVMQKEDVMQIVGDG